MFCKICGKETLNESNICEQCELASLEEEIEEAEVQEVEVIDELPEEEIEELENEKPKKSKKGFATAAMILGFCAMFIPILNIVTAILAIVFGIIGRKHDLGVVGLVAGIVYFVNRICIGIMTTIFYVFYIAIYVIAILVNVLPR